MRFPLSSFLFLKYREKRGDFSDNGLGSDRQRTLESYAMYYLMVLSRTLVAATRKMTENRI